MVALAIATILTSLTASPAFAPKRTALLIIAHPAAEMPFESESFASAAARESERLGDHWIVDRRELRRSATCSLDTFTRLGFDLSLCGEAAPIAAVDQLLVFELDLAQGRSWVRAAYVDPQAPAAPHRLDAVVSGRERATVVRDLFGRLFAGFGRIRLGPTIERNGYLFIDGHWVADVARAREMLVAPGLHLFEVRCGGERVRIGEVLVAAAELAKLDVSPDEFVLAAR